MLVLIPQTSNVLWRSNNWLKGTRNVSITAGPSWRLKNLWAIKLTLHKPAGAKEMAEAYPGFFQSLVKQQSPELLWIGCSDSRVPANEVSEALGTIRKPFHGLFATVHNSNKTISPAHETPSRRSLRPPEHRQHRPHSRPKLPQRHPIRRRRSQNSSYHRVSSFISSPF